MADLANEAWWDREEERDIHDTVWNVATSLKNEQGDEAREIGDAALTAYFGNSRHLTQGKAADPSDVLRMLDIDASGGQPGQNVIRECVDTRVAYTVQNKIRPFFLTEAGSVNEREQAQGMMRAVEGVFRANGAYSHLGRRVAKHGFIFDGGFVRVVPDYERNRVSLRSVYPWHWLVPDGDGVDPRQGHELMAVDRYQLIADFPDFKDEILEADSAPAEMVGDVRRPTGTDRVLVIESIHLPSGYVDLDDDAAWGLGKGKGKRKPDPGHDGLRTLSISNKLLLSEPWPLERFMLSGFFPLRNPTDYWSCGIPELLAGGQLKLDRWEERVDAALYFHAIPRLLMQKGKVNRNHFTTNLAAFIETNGPPGGAAMYLQPQPIPSELFNERQRIVEWMKEQAGVNNMMLSGERPVGVDHAPGMEHLTEVTQQRHFEGNQAWEDCWVECGQNVIEACRWMAKKDPQFETFWGDAKSMQRIRWKDVELERKTFMVVASPANLLPQSPGMKISRLERLRQVNPDLAVRAATAMFEEFPDVGAVLGDTNAREKNIQKSLDRCAREGLTDETMPTTYMIYPDAALAKQLAVDRINRLEVDGASPETVDNVIKWFEACNKIAKQGEAQVPPPPPPVAAGDPMAPPNAATPPMNGAPPMLQ
ncbi:MAG TPA: hypothetical protein VFZ21_30985 [Gemmatimonadaceae bacterium]|nr:hypothetical protein [Gemmatimonadaceae bacterium]